MNHTPHDHTDHAALADVQRRLDHAAATLRQAAARQPRQVGVCLHCLRALDLLLDAGARPDTDQATDTCATGDGADEDTQVLIRAALASLGGLPATEFARAPIHLAARTARRALALTGENLPSGTAPRDRR